MPQPPAYPVSDHFNGAIFFNPPAMEAAHIPPVPIPVEAGPKGKPRKRGGLISILRWRFREDRQPWPVLPPDPAPAGDPHRLPPPGAVSVTFIGHSSFLIRLPNLTILTDPVFSDRCSPVSWAGPKRARPPGRAFRDLPKIDLLLLSHNHYDHMDFPSLRAIRRRDDPVVVTPLGNARHLAKVGLNRVTELDWWGETRLADGTSITVTPARHFSARTLWDRGQSLWGGFMLKTGRHQIFFAGDSGHGRHWATIGQRLGSPDLALIPIGAYEPRQIMAAVHVNPAEAVAAHVAMGARQSIGMHFGTFKLTDEPIGAPPRDMAAARAAAGLADDAFVTLGSGETRLFSL
ncbi:MBL fold metallo-hydrolase [Acidisoma cellulosilyticum]|nr:MBL fold metallo-hydrolase [Acidisoma cellulosilyticum]